MTLIMVDACELATFAQQQVPGWEANNLLVLGARTGNGHYTEGHAFVWKRYVIPVADRHATMTVGFAFRPNFAANGLRYLTVFTAPTVAAVDLILVPSGGNQACLLQLARRKDGTILWTSDSPLVDSTAFTYIEIKMTVHPTAGAIELRTNEVTRVLLTGIDTTSATAGDTVIAAVQWGAGQANSVMAYTDDIYLNNGAGSANNSFNGDTTVHALHPTASGSLTQFTPVGAAANWDNVNEVDQQTTDYNEGNLITLTDLYNIANLPAAVAGKQVFGVQLHGVLASASLPRSGALVIGSAELNTEPAVIVLTTTPTGYRYVMETKPGGGSWSTADVDAAQIGVRVKS